MALVTPSNISGSSVRSCVTSATASSSAVLLAAAMAAAGASSSWALGRSRTRARTRWPLANSCSTQRFPTPPVAPVTNTTGGAPLGTGLPSKRVTAAAKPAFLGPARRPRAAAGALSNAWPLKNRNCSVNCPNFHLGFSESASDAAMAMVSPLYCSLRPGRRRRNSTRNSPPISMKGAASSRRNTFRGGRPLFLGAAFSDAASCCAPGSALYSTFCGSPRVAAVRGWE
mmetsp:Transcript_63165/g.104348  ORF Transcript_63165/g.104348 Transcript_63165/m.104348 type:complete len:228 (-) Transcript_63165:243-926(-)